MMTAAGPPMGAWDGMPTPTSSPRFDVTVRVGCSLAYEATGTAVLLLNLRPSPDRNHIIVRFSQIPESLRQYFCERS